MSLNSTIIYGFVKSCLVKGFDGSLETPKFHHELWDLFCSNNKYVAVAAPRGHAKSTAGTITYALSCLLFREKRHVLIVSNTEDQAAAFVQEIRNIISDNEFIKNHFDFQLDDKGEVKFDRDTNTDVICRFKDGTSFRVFAKGSNQRMRGILWNGTRPDLILCDDLEDDEICMNKDRREKFRNWFMNALLPCKASAGTVRMVGTILHLDSLLERLMPKERSSNTIVEELKMSSIGRNASAWTSVKYRAHNKDFSSILWEQKFSKDELLSIRDMYVSQGNPAGYAQEYLNIPIDESTAHFKRSDFLPMSTEDIKKPKNFYVTADLAISEKDRADYSVFIVGGVDESNVLHIVDIIQERMDGKQIVDTIIRLQAIYKPMAFGIEEMQVSKAIGPFLREEMLLKNAIANLIPLSPHKSDKLTRTYSIQARLRLGSVRFNTDLEYYSDLEDQLCQFPRSKHDDMVDGMSYMGLLLDYFVESNTQEEIDEDEANEEFESYQQQQGRSEITGY